MNNFSDVQKKSSEQLQMDVAAVRKEIGEVRETLSQFKVTAANKSSRKGLFSSRRQSIPVEYVPETHAKPPIRLDELLPLLPQLGSMIPQLKNPKVAETLKLLSNPAIAGMIQQFATNSGGKRKPEVIEPRRLRA